MRPLQWFEPREHWAAARSYATLSGVACVTTFLSTPIRAEWTVAETLLPAAALLVLVAGVSRLLFLTPVSRHWIWAVAALGPVPCLIAFDLITDDASLTAQIFFVFPALYGASQLRVPGAIAMTTTALTGEIVVVFALLEPRAAFVDAWFVGAVIVTSASLLAVGRERQARLVQRLEDLAAVDPLTGLATRRVLDEAASSALSGAGTDAGTALVLLDVDHFKTINDDHGHPAGDAVLVQLAGVLRGHTRRSDVICRLGGDEIAVLMSGCDEGVAVHRAREILTAIQNHHFRADDGRSLAVSVSMGCAHLPTHAKDLRELYSAADGALYRAKLDGRGRMVAAGPARA